MCFSRITKLKLWNSFPASLSVSQYSVSQEFDTSVALAQFILTCALKNTARRLFCSWMNPICVPNNNLRNTAFLVHLTFDIKEEQDESYCPWYDVVCIWSYSGWLMSCNTRRDTSGKRNSEPQQTFWHAVSAKTQLKCRSLITLHWTHVILIEWNIFSCVYVLKLSASHPMLQSLLFTVVAFFPPLSDIVHPELFANCLNPACFCFWSCPLSWICLLESWCTVLLHIACSLNLTVTHRLKWFCLVLQWNFTLPLFASEQRRHAAENMS